MISTVMLWLIFHLALSVFVFFCLFLLKTLTSGTQLVWCIFTFSAFLRIINSSTLCLLLSDTQEAIPASFPNGLCSTDVVTCNRSVVTTSLDWWGRSELFMTAEAIQVIWPAVSTHHQGPVRIVLLYWFWRVAQSCLCLCLWQAARICFFEQERGTRWQQWWPER